MRKLLIVILVIALALLAFINYTKRVQLASDLKQLSVKMDQLGTGNDPQNIAKAKEIIEKVRRHMEIPTDPEPTVATIVDVNALKSKNDFYKNAKNGDNLIVTPARAILYDPDKDVIIDVVPVQLEPTEPTSSAPAAAR
jgi:outer membrane murein-binding lipoprotein Lpp